MTQSHKISPETKLKCRILHEFLVQVLLLNRFFMEQLKSDNENGKTKNKSKPKTRK